MTAARFDELIHAPTRLAIVSLLAASHWADFRFIRDELRLSDSALSKQLTTLETAGYVQIRKGFAGKRPRTWARLSRTGRRAFEQHVAGLRDHSTLIWSLMMFDAFLRDVHAGVALAFDREQVTVPAE